MRVIKLTEALPDEEVNQFGGRFLSLSGESESLGNGRMSRPWAGVKHIIRQEATTILKPDGTPLVIYQPHCIPRGLIEVAFTELKKVPRDIPGAPGTQPRGNRGLAAGLAEEVGDSALEDVAATIGGTRYAPLKGDGTVSNTTYATAEVDSKVIGSFDRYPRIPFCRLTAFNIDHHQEFENARPFVVYVSELFRKTLPERYAAQKAVADKTAAEWLIKDTVFTTITVNRNWRTACHKDAGDFKDGFGVMSVMEGGKYEGCELIFPKYRVAVDMRTGGHCLADVHEWHGNAPLRGVMGQYYRMSLVFYYRAKMVECGTSEEERARAENWSTEFQARRASVGQFPAAETLLEEIEVEAPNLTDVEEEPVPEDTPLQTFTPEAPPTAVQAPEQPVPAPSALSQATFGRFGRPVAVLPGAAPGFKKPAAAAVTPPPAAAPPPPAVQAVLNEMHRPAATPPPAGKKKPEAEPSLFATPPEPPPVQSAAPGTSTTPPQGERKWPELWNIAQEMAEELYRKLCEQRERAPW